MIGARPPIELDLDAVVRAAEQTGTALEINGGLPRLDMSVEVVEEAPPDRTQPRAFVIVLIMTIVGFGALFGAALVVGALSLLTLALQGGTNPIFMLVCATIANFSLASVSVSIYVFTSELYPTRMRALGCGMGSTVRNIFTTLSPWLVALMLSGYGLPGVFTMLGLAPLIPCLMIFAFGTETKGRVLEEVSP